VPKPYPEEFREDVVRVARNRPDGVTLEQVAADFGVHPMTLSKWLRVAAVEDGSKPGVTRAEQSELRQARKRIKLLEQENEVLRRAAAYLSQANLPGKALPARERAGRRRDPRRVLAALVGAVCGLIATDLMVLDRRSALLPGSGTRTV
jgi:transposase